MVDTRISTSRKGREKLGHPTRHPLYSRPAAAPFGYDLTILYYGARLAGAQ
jgi:hypothetical protein